VFKARVGTTSGVRSGGAGALGAGTSNGSASRKSVAEPA